MTNSHALRIEQLALEATRASEALAATDLAPSDTDVLLDAIEWLERAAQPLRDALYRIHHYGPARSSEELEAARQVADAHQP